MEATPEWKREAYRAGDYRFNARYLPSAACYGKWTVDDWCRFVDAHGAWVGGK